MAKTAQEKADLKAEKLYKKTHKSKMKLKPGDIVFNIINYLIFGLFTLACIFPFYYLFINTISDNDLVVKGVINFIPRGLNLDNYKALLNVSDLSNAFIVSVSRTILGTALMVLASGFVGYLVTKQEMWGRKFWYRFLIVTMYFNAGLIPWFMNMQMLGLTNTFWAYIIPGIVAPYNIILVKTYIESIPAELEESAQMDGATYMTVFRKIIWPLSKPILATIAIFGAVGHWNSFTDSLMLMQSAPQLYTLQHRLYIYLNQASNLSALMESGGQVSEAALKSALSGKVIKYTISMVTVIPILVVYPFMQRYFEEGIMLGAVKG
ncbi:MAG: carbohydrate ABC transporter permease [Lachnospiraceae bacterium]|nr:carbohydrate ABC transporter permease [Lachnospiraceae bacterium]